MRFAAAAAFVLSSTAAAQGTTGPIWNPPGGTGGVYCSGVTGPSGENVSAVYSLGAGAGQPWTPLTAVAVAPYGQMTFFTAAPATAPLLISLNAAGGTTNFRQDLCATYFAGCATNPVSAEPAAAPATDALRVFVAATYLNGAGGTTYTLAAAAADMSSGASVWAPTSPVVLDTLPNLGAPASLLVMGTTLWVASASPSAPHLLDTATGKLLASNWTAQQQSVCDLLAPQHAVCTVGGRGAALRVTTVYDTSALPPRPLWTNYMAAQLIAADAGQLVAQTGLAPGALALSGFALDTGALAWSLPAPWVGFGLAAGGAALAYDDAGTLWAAWLGFDETQQYSAIVATYSLAAEGGAAQIANVSLSVAGTLNGVQGLVISNNGRLGYLTLTDAVTGTTSVLTLQASSSALSFAGTAFAVPAATRLQAVPGPQDGQLIIGQLTAAGQPSMAVYA